MRNGEATTFEMEGTGTLSVAGVAVPFPVYERRDWSTDLLASLGSVLRTCGDAPADLPCIESSTHRWGDIGGSRTLLHSELVVRNPTPVPIPLGQRSLTLSLHDVPVASSTSDTRIVLPAQGTARVLFTTAVDHERLEQWWPRHVASCETSPVTVSLQLLPNDALSLRLPAPPLETHIACP